MADIIETTAVEKAVEKNLAVTIDEIKESGISAVWTDKQTFNQVLRAADLLSKTQMIPQQYQGKPQDCFVALEMASRTGLPPLVVLQNLYIVKGKPSWSGQACLALINSCGRFRDAHPVYVGEKGTESRGCYVTATRISDGEKVEGPEVNIKMAAAEGWTSNQKWRNMPELMLAYRASAFFARTNCPEALMGAKVEGEWDDIDKRQPQQHSGITAALDAAIGGDKK